MVSLKQLYEWFATGKFPTEPQFQEQFKSFWHKSERLPLTQILGLQEEIAKATTNFKGYHTSLDALLLAHPQNQNRKDFFAWVGSPYPGTVYKVFANGGAWTDTGEVPTQEEIDLTEYAKAKNNTGELVVYAPDGKIITKEITQEETTTPSNFAVSEFKKDVFELPELIEVVPMAIPGTVASGVTANYWLTFENWHLMSGKTINSIKVSIKQSGTFSVMLCKQGSTNATLIKKYNVITGINDLDINVSLKDDEFLGFLNVGDTAIMFRPTNVDVLTGGIYYFNSNIGAWETMTTASISIGLYQFRTDIQISDIVRQNGKGIKVDGTIIDAANLFLSEVKVQGAEIVNLQVTPNLDGTGGAFFDENDSYISGYTFKHGQSAQGERKNINVPVNATVLKFSYGTDEIMEQNKYPLFDYVFVKYGNSIVSRIIALEGKTDSNGGGSIPTNSEEREQSTLQPSLIIENTYQGDETLKQLVDCNCIVYKGLKKGRKYQLKYGKRFVSSVDNSPLADRSYIGVYRSFQNSLTQKVDANILGSGTKEVEFVPQYDCDICFNIKLTTRTWSIDITDTLKVVEIKGEDNEISIVDRSILLNDRDLTNITSISIEEPKWCVLDFMTPLFLIKSADERVNCVIEYRDSNNIKFQFIGETARQGNSTVARNYGKQNYKFKMKTLNGDKLTLQMGDWLPRSSFQVKANFVDITQVRNGGSALFITEVWKTRGRAYLPWLKYDPSEDSASKRFGLRGKGIIGSIPCVLMQYGGFYGNYTFNLNAFADNYELSSKTNPLGRVYKGGAGNGFISVSKLPWEEVVSDTEANDMTDETFEPMKNLTNWLISCRNNQAKYKTEFEQHFNLNSAIDYYLILWFGDIFDDTVNNMMLYTNDSQIFHFLFWDMDTCFGVGYQGVNHRPHNVETKPTSDSNLWRHFEASFMDELKLRYKELRDLGVFSVDTVDQTYGALSRRFPVGAYEKDVERWGSEIPSNWTKGTVVPTEIGNVTSNGSSSIAQMLDWTEKRIPFLDDKFGYNQ